MKRFCPAFFLVSKRGFTLLEVLIVVVIAVLVTTFAVPAYRKAQMRTRFMAATGVLTDIDNAARMVHEDFPTVVFNSTISSNLLATGSCVSDPRENPILFLFCNRYLNEIPFDASGGTYQGYIFSISFQGTYSCRTCGSGMVACMEAAASTPAEYQCAGIDMAGNLHIPKAQ